MEKDTSMHLETMREKKVAAHTLSIFFWTDKYKTNDRNLYILTDTPVKTSTDRDEEKRDTIRSQMRKDRGKRDVGKKILSNIINSINNSSYHFSSHTSSATLASS